MANSRKTPEPDPIFAAIAEHKSRRKEWARLEKEINNIQEAGNEKGRGRPVELIAWRGYSIGNCEIDRTREEFLRQPGADPEQIEKESLRRCVSNVSRPGAHGKERAINWLE